MNTTHTPGPWRTVGDTEVRAGVAVICETAQYRAPALSEQAAADARLIAAAPDMIDALRVLEKMAQTTAKAFPNAPGVGDWHRAALIARAAIDRATA